MNERESDEPRANDVRYLFVCEVYNRDDSEDVLLSNVLGCERERERERESCHKARVEGEGSQFSPLCVSVNLSRRARMVLGRSEDVVPDFCPMTAERSV